jgi:hypothetical protein
MLNKLVSNLIQRAVSSNDAPYTPQPVVKQPLPVYLSLELLEENSTFDPFATTTELKPGKTYALHVWATTEVQEGQAAITVGSQLELFLKSSHETVKIDSCGAIKCHLDHRDQPLHTFSLNVAEDCPKAEVTFQMVYRKVNSQYRSFLPPLETILAGTHYAPDKELLKRCEIYDSQLPDNTAILHIQKGKDDSYSKTLHINGWSYQQRPLQISQVVDDMSLGDWIDQGEKPETIRNLVRGFSKNQVELINWLQCLIHDHQDKLTLIIVNHTLSELPWEIVELDDDQFLGAYANVVRWTWVGGRGTYHKLQVIEETVPSGEILCYLSQSVSKTEEAKLLEKFVVNHCQNPYKLRQKLEHSLEKISLVYLACHGTFNRKLRKKENILAVTPFTTHYRDSHVATLGDGIEQINLVDLESLTKRDGIRPLFLVNACHSARLMDKQFKPYGFLNIFMSTVASGYIGTMATVNSDYAAKMAQKLLDKAHTEPEGIPIAKRLKQIRHEVVEELKANPNEDNWKAFINTFLYVYYGNPLARLKLKPKP